MILVIKQKLLVLGLLLVCVRKVIPLSRTNPRLSNINWDNSEGSGYESHSRSFDDYDDEGLTSGWDSSGDDTSVVSSMDSLCVFSGLKSRHTGTKVYLSITFEELCGKSTDPETRKKCLKTICQCFSTDRDYSVHFKKHFSIECVATGNTGRRNNNYYNSNNNNRPTAVVPRVQSTTWPSSNPTRLYPINYDDDDDEHDDEYTVEIDRSRVTELEKEKSSGHLHGIMSKTGLLASIMGGTIIGLLCAVLLAMFIVYRVKKRRSAPHHHSNPKSPPCPPLKGYTKNFEECDFYA